MVGDVLLPEIKFRGVATLIGRCSEKELQFVAVC